MGLEGVGGGTLGDSLDGRGWRFSVSVSVSVDEPSLSSSDGERSASSQESATSSSSFLGFEGGLVLEVEIWRLEWFFRRSMVV